MSYYDILGVERTASKSAIKKAYYTMAKQCHPDKNPDDPKSKKRAQKKFIALSKAYTHLMDDVKRAEYDARPNNLDSEEEDDSTSSEEEGFFAYASAFVSTTVQSLFSQAVEKAMKIYDDMLNSLYEVGDQLFGESEEDTENTSVQDPPTINVDLDESQFDQKGPKKVDPVLLLESPPKMVPPMPSDPEEDENVEPLRTQHRKPVETAKRPSTQHRKPDVTAERPSTQHRKPDVTVERPSTQHRKPVETATRPPVETPVDSYINRINPSKRATGPTPEELKNFKWPFWKKSMAENRRITYQFAVKVQEKYQDRENPAGLNELLSSITRKGIYLSIKVGGKRHTIRSKEVIGILKPMLKEARSKRMRAEF